MTAGPDVVNGLIRNSTSGIEAMTNGQPSGSPANVVALRSASTETRSAPAAVRTLRTATATFNRPSQTATSLGSPASWPVCSCTRSAGHSAPGSPKRSKSDCAHGSSSKALVGSMMPL